MITRRRAAEFLTLGLTLCLCVFYFPYLAGTGSFYLSDITYYFQPFSEFIRQSAREGRLPLWNPNLYCGMSQIAVPSPGLFYPPAWLMYTLPFSQGLALYLVLHQLVCGSGAFLLVTSFGWGLFAGAIAGVAAALCGYMFALSTNFTLVASAAWLPLLIYFLSKVEGEFTKENLRWLLASSIATALCVGAGRPEISAPCLIIAGAYVLGAAWIARRQQFKRQLAWRLGSMLGGIALAAPVVIPALEWVRLSPRANGLELKWVLMWSANWYDLVCIVLPQPFGDLTALGNKFLNLAASRFNAIPYVSSSYLGPVLVTLAFWGLCDKHWRYRYVVAGASLFALLMALGSYTPVAPFVSSISPAFASFRYPVKLMIVALFGLILLSARGASICGRRQVGPIVLAITGAIWLSCLGGAAVVLASDGFALLAQRMDWVARTGLPLTTIREAQVALAISVSVAAVQGLMFSAVYLAYLKGILPGNLFKGCVCFGVAILLMAPALQFSRHTTNADFLDRPVPFAKKVRDLLDVEAGPHQGRALSLYFDPLEVPPWFQSAQQLPFQEAFYQYARQIMLPNGNVHQGVPYAHGYEAAEVGRYKEMFLGVLGVSSQSRQGPSTFKSDAPLARFCQITATRLALTQAFRAKGEVRKLDARWFEMLEEDRIMNLRVYRFKQFEPRVRLLSDLRWSADWKYIEKRVHDLKSDQLMDAVYVREQRPASWQPDSADVDGSAKIVEDRPEVLKIEVESRSPKVLLVTDQHYPGWQTRLDGKEVPCYKANGFARAVLVPAGKHVIDMVYKPASLSIGLLTAGLALLLWILLYWLSTRASSGRLILAMRPRSSVG